MILEANLHIVDTKDGGRQGPIFSGYRPRLWIGEESSDCVVTFDGEKLFPNSNATTVVEILHPGNFKSIIVGDFFQLKEGRRITVIGEVKTFF